MIDRRMFIVQAAALPFAWRARDATAIDAALARAKQTGRWAVVLVAPAETRARFEFGRALWRIADHAKDVDAHDLLCQAAFAVVMPGVAKFQGNRALYAPDGTLLAADTAAPEVYASGAAFATSFRAFMHGPDGQRLAERARAIETPELQELARRLAAKDVNTGLGARDILRTRMEGITPWVARQALAGVEPARELLRQYYATQPVDAHGARVPYGCATPYDPDPCPTCGLAEVPANASKFLRVLTGDPKLDALPAPK